MSHRELSLPTALMQNVQTPSTTLILPAFSASAPFTPALAVVGYARVSTELQREKETIKTQVERYCVERGYRLVEMICDDGVSGLYL